MARPSPSGNGAVSALEASGQQIADLLTQELDAALGVAASAADELQRFMLLFVTSNAAQDEQTFLCTQDGFVLGYASTATASFAISVNVSPMTAAPTGAGVYQGQIAWGNNDYVADRMPTELRIPFRAGDTLRVRTLVATSMSILMLLGYVISPRGPLTQ